MTPAVRTTDTVSSQTFAYVQLAGMEQPVSNLSMARAGGKQIASHSGPECKAIIL